MEGFCLHARSDDAAVLAAAQAALHRKFKMQIQYETKHVVEASEFVITGVNLPTGVTEIRINQHASEDMTLEFRDKSGTGQFTILVRGGQLLFSRHVSRPNHDHDDSQSLVVEEKTGKLLFRTRHPYPGEGFEMLRIPFGGIEG